MMTTGSCRCYVHEYAGSQEIRIRRLTFTETKIMQQIENWNCRGSKNIIQNIFIITISELNLAWRLKEGGNSLSYFHHFLALKPIQHFFPQSKKNGFSVSHHKNVFVMTDTLRNSKKHKDVFAQSNSKRIMTPHVYKSPRKKQRLKIKSGLQTCTISTSFHVYHCRLN